MKYLGKISDVKDLVTKEYVDGKTWAASAITSGTLGVARGGTGATTFTSGNLLVGNGTGAVTTIAKTNANTANTVVVRDGSGNFSAGTITANLSGIATTAVYATYLSNASNHGITLANSTWGGSNPWNMTNKTLVWGQNGKNTSYASDSADIGLYYGNTSASGGAGWFMMIDGGIYSMGAIYGAVWNDYAEFRTTMDAKPGQCVKEIGDGTLILTTSRLEKGCSVISDTYGHAIGWSDDNKTPIAVSGRVLAYPYESIEEFKNNIGVPVCSGPNGTVSIMTEEEERLYPSRIIGTISEIPTYERWGTGNVEVNGRVWIKVK